MKFSISRENLLEPLQLVSGVVERRQTLPILSNLLTVIEEGRLVITGTDQEVELTATCASVIDGENGKVTIPARKFTDICRSLPPEAVVQIALNNNKISVESGRFKSHLATLPALDFPEIKMEEPAVELSINGPALVKVLDKISFAMAQQDVRYFFNGMLFELSHGRLRTVATNGQRLAISEIEVAYEKEENSQFIVPRKGIIELSRLMKDVGDQRVMLQFSSNHLKVTKDGSSLTTKLIDGTYPDYSRAIPENSDKTVFADREELREALSRIAILSNEVYRNVRLHLSNGKVEFYANNPQHEEAEETVAVDYQGEELEIGFNVSYLIDVLSTLEGEKVVIELSDSNSAALMRDPEDSDSRFIVSPMML